MPSHKTLKSVSHNFGHSFVSFMNYMETDYFLGLLQTEMRKTGLNKLEVDILNNKSQPNELLTRKIMKSIAYWTKWFPKLVEDSGSSMDFVNSAKMTIEFDLTLSRPYPHDNRFIENPYVCGIKIVDDNGKEYLKEQKGWWFPEVVEKKTIKETVFDKKESFWDRIKTMFNS